MLKRTLVVFICFCFVFLVACGSEVELRDSSATALELIENVQEKMLWGNEIFDKNNAPLDPYYYTYFFGAESEEDFFGVVSDYALAKQVSTSVDEVGVFKINIAFDEEAYRQGSDLTGDALERDLQNAKAAFIENNFARAEAFCKKRIGMFVNQTENYDAEEHIKAQNALVARHGYYVYYILSGDNASIQNIITAQIDAKAV